MPDDKSEILAMLRAQEKAIARADATNVLAAQTDGVVIYDLPPPLQYRPGSDRDPGALEEWFATWTDGVTTEMSNPTVLVDGDLAVVFALSRMRGTKKDGGSVDSWNRRTIVLQRDDSRWRIVHEHSSYPMAMDGSGKALTDLKPE